MAVAVDRLSALRTKKLLTEIKGNMAGFETRLTKRMENSRDLILGSLLLTLQNRTPGDENHVATKIAAMATCVKRGGGGGGSEQGY